TARGSRCARRAARACSRPSGPHRSTPSRAPGTWWRSAGWPTSPGRGTGPGPLTSERRVARPPAPPVAAGPDVAEAYDAIVIGAGPNGLVAANRLVDAGWHVLVLEAAAEPGGAVRTAEVTAPGFRNDLFSAFYPLAVGSSVLGDLELGRHGLRW